MKYFLVSQDDLVAMLREAVEEGVVVIDSSEVDVEEFAMDNEVRFFNMYEVVD